MPAATGALPSVIAVILGDLVAFFIIVVRQGFTPQAWQQYAFVAGSVTALAIIPIYFEHRRAYAPNRVEVVLAWLWTTLRQLLGTAVAVMIVLFALANLRKGQWITGSFAALFGAGILWMAWFGGGYLRSFGDDRPAHLERKRRYGWK